MSKHTQPFWQLFCLSFAKKMTKVVFGALFYGVLINHRERRETDEKNTEMLCEHVEILTTPE